MSQRQTWDAGRFLKTVTFFDIFPFLNIFPGLKRMILGQQQPQTQPSSQTRIGTILAIGATGSLGEQVVKGLLEKNYPVRVLVPSLERVGRDRFAARADYGEGDLARPASLQPDVMAGVQAIAYCLDDRDTAAEMEGIKTLLRLAVLALGTDPKTTPLFDFTRPTPSLQAMWGAIDDVVMGGVSESHLRLTDNVAIFAGNVSTANSGGFASVRHRNLNPPLDLSRYDGLRLRVKGDGQRYKFILRCEGKWDG
jgi:Complex I intermediate-associated protein 30 (CIA30)/NmrA-like family